MTTMEPAQTDLLGDRRTLAYNLRKQGLKYKDVGTRMGVGAQRARQLYKESERRLNREPHWSDGLNVRVARVVQHMNMKK